jgi:hypothetical protein
MTSQQTSILHVFRQSVPGFPTFTAFSNGNVCDSPQREAHELHQRLQSLQEIRGSAVEGPAVCSGSHAPGNKNVPYRVAVSAMA